MSYPTVNDLARAEEDEVMRIWQGLGYYSRARNLHKTAKIIAEELNGKFPKTYQGLLKLPGVGDYTASAISSICFDEAQGVLDGNVFRLFSRYFGIEDPIDTTWGRKLFKDKVNGELPMKNIGDFNQGLMELGALICSPKNPDCVSCPLRRDCVARITGKISSLPVKKGRIKKSKEYWVFEICEEREKIAIVKRKQGIWKGLYELPNKIYSSEKDVPEENLLNLSPVVHELSHKTIHAFFQKGSVLPDHIRKNDEILFIEKNELANYAMPILIVRFLEEYLN
jgi:A/G-specific adenine glycosylase